jgi:MFS family permease
MSVRIYLSTRLAIASFFFIHGFITGAWVPHIPLAQQRLNVDLATFGLALLALAAGAVSAMPVAGALINRFGSARVTIVTGVLFSLAFPLPALAQSLPLFVLGLAAFGATIGSMDVAMNAQGLAVEKTLRRPIMSLLHGMFSVGAMAGAGVSALVLDRISVTAHVASAAFVAAAVVLIAGAWLLPADADRGLPGNRFFALPSRATLGLGSLCFLVLMAEGAVLDWSAIQLKQEFGLLAGRAAVGYALFSAGMALARFAGDKLRSSFGSVKVVRWSAILLAAAMVPALFAGSANVSIAAYGLAGLGIGNIVPVLFGGGGRLEPQHPGRGIAAVVAMGYAGFVVGPPFIGLLGEAIGISKALLAIVAGAVIIAAAARLAQTADISQRQQKVRRQR